MERLVDWLGPALEPWGYVLLGLATMLEASAFVGLAVPGEAALLFAGFLAQQGRLSLSLAIAVAFLGAVAGDSIGYEIGRHGGERLRRTRVGRWVGDERWDRAHRLLQRHGALAVFFGRFLGVVRAMVPAVAGDARLPYPKFLLWNVLGAAAWSTATVLVGYAVGSAYTAVASWLGWGSLALVAVAVIVAVVVKIARRRRPSSKAPERDQPASVASIGSDSVASGDGRGSAG
jgi:membrane protein DedA with SNARE-associated domain